MQQEPRQFQQGIVGGVSLTVLLVVAVAAIYKGLNSQVPNTTQAVITSTPLEATPALKISKDSANSAVDSFSQAVRVAQLRPTRQEWRRPELKIACCGTAFDVRSTAGR